MERESTIVVAVLKVMTPKSYSQTKNQFQDDAQAHLPLRGALSSAERSRYARHLLLPEVGAEGQARLKQARVLCVGAGGLGSPALLYLAAAGVGTLGLVDDDRVELSNLQRQILHGTEDVGRAKLDSAAQRLAGINPHVKLELHPMRFHASNALSLLSGYDLIIDGTDNFPTRYLSNDAAVISGKPNVYASIYRFEGQLSVFAPHLGGPCYRCMFPEAPPPGTVPSCAEGGVFGALPGIMGSFQALEAIKVLLGIGQPAIGQLLAIDTLSLRVRTIRLARDPDCPLCGEAPYITSLHPERYEEVCEVPAQLDFREITPAALYEILQETNGHAAQLVDVRSEAEWEINRLPGATLLPLPQLKLSPSAKTLDLAAPVYVYCKGGARSLEAAELLSRAGCQEVHSLAGGIDAWIREIDPSLPRY